MKKIVIFDANRDDYGWFSTQNKRCKIPAPEDNCSYKELVELVEQEYASLKTDKERDDCAYRIIEFPDEANVWIMTDDEEEE